MSDRLQELIEIDRKNKTRLEELNNQMENIKNEISKINKDRLKYGHELDYLIADADPRIRFTKKYQLNYDDYEPVECPAFDDSKSYYGSRGFYKKNNVFYVEKCFGCYIESNYKVLPDERLNLLNSRIHNFNPTLLKRSKASMFYSDDDRLQRENELQQDIYPKKCGVYKYDDKYYLLTVPSYSKYKWDDVTKSVNDKIAEMNRYDF